MITECLRLPRRAQARGVCLVCPKEDISKIRTYDRDAAVDISNRDRATPHGWVRRSSFRSEFTEPVGCCDPSIHEEVAAGDERPIRPHQESADSADLIRGSGASDRGELDHALIARAAWACQFVLGERCDDDARTDRVDPRAALTPLTASAITRSELPRLDS